MWLQSNLDEMLRTADFPSINIRHHPDEKQVEEIMKDLTASSDQSLKTFVGIT